MRCRAAAASASVLWSTAFCLDVGGEARGLSARRHRRSHERSNNRSLLAVIDAHSNEGLYGCRPNVGHQLHHELDLLYVLPLKRVDYRAPLTL